MPTKPAAHQPHTNQKPNAKGPGKFSHLYTSRRWRKLRAVFLNQYPLCTICLGNGKTTAATVVDHVDPHQGDMEKFWAGPFQALCKPCHDSHKKIIEKGGKVRRIGLDGYPVT